MISRFQDGYWFRGLELTLRSIGSIGIFKPLVPMAPYLVVWNFTNACNLRCLHCYQFGVHTHELDTSERFWVLDRIIDAGVVGLAFSGGEQLIHPDLTDIARHARIHDGFRGVSCFERTMAGIGACIDSGINLCIAATKYNIDQIPKIYELAKSLGAVYFTLFNFVPVESGAANPQLDLDPDQREQLLRWLGYGAIQDADQIKVFCAAPQFGRILEQLNSELGTQLHVPSHYGIMPRLSGLLEFIGGCGFGRMYAAIGPDGSLKPRVFSQLSCGNLLEQDLIQIWRSRPILKLARDRSQLGEIAGAANISSSAEDVGLERYAYHEVSPLQIQDASGIGNHNAQI